jgi:orotidine-5'-phosphate decarboxylase
VMLRKSLPDAFIVTPGIRLPGDKAGDQVRVMGPKEAIHAGSSALVIGRSILDAADPVKVAKEINQLLDS